MPTTQITPQSADLLQHVADTLAKARKMVIITGAGISTNSGIPDFRSENGLYSLIQEQFERAEANAKKDTIDDDVAAFDISDRPSKRRRLSGPSQTSQSEVQVLSEAPTSQDRTLEVIEAKMEVSNPGSGQGNSLKAHEDATEDSNPFQRLTRSRTAISRPELPRYPTQHSSDSSTCQSSQSSDHAPSSASSQSDAATITELPRLTRDSVVVDTPKRMAGSLASSSPLSSPPPILFDPYENSNSSTDSSSRVDYESSDTSDSEEDTQQSFDMLSLQASNSNLRNMKGRDLFDCNIWADPLKTSVFYRFATSLRQRIREVEPTTTHRFIAQMRDVGKLARVYTQNIDEIEKKIGLSTDLTHGAGNKRRKTIKPAQPESEKTDQESSSQRSDASSPDSTENLDASQQPDDAAQTKLRSSPPPDKGVECVFLHGSLHSLRCFVCGKLCNWDEEGREFCTLSGEQPECPHCAGATAARQERGKRALGIGKLRPDIVLYGEDHPQSDLISPIIQHDLNGNPDLLLVLGTSLRVHGLKVMVREFAKAVHTKGGKVIFINLTKPSDSAWGDVLDYWIEWDCDAWVEDLKDRKPNLWLSPDELQELDKQKREALAEKKRETLKKRESINEKKRVSLGDGPQDSPEDTKPKPIPKNPSAMRNDYGCGAYVVWEIFQVLAKIGDRPFDNLGYTPPMPVVQAVPTPDLPADSQATNDQNSKQGVNEQSKTRPKRKRKSAPDGIPGQPPATVSNAEQSGQSLGPEQIVPLPQKVNAGTAGLKLTFEGYNPAKVVGKDAKSEKQAPKRKKPRKSAPAALVSTTITKQGRTPLPTGRISEATAGKGQYLKAARELARTRRTPTPGYSAMPNQPPATPTQPQLNHAPFYGQLHPAMKPSSFEEPVHLDRRHSVYELGASYPTGSRPILPPPDPVVFGNGVVGRYSPPSSVPRSEVRYEGPVLAPLNWDWKKSPPAKITPMEPAPVVSPLSPPLDMRPGSNPVYSFPRHPSYNEELRHPASNQKDPSRFKNSDLTPSPSDQLHLEAAYQLSQMSGRP